MRNKNTTAAKSAATTPARRSRRHKPDQDPEQAKRAYETALALMRVELDASTSLVTRATWLGTLMSGVLTLVLTFGATTWFADLSKYDAGQRFALVASGALVALLLACAALGALWGARPSSGSQKAYKDYRESVARALNGNYSEAARYRQLRYACTRRFSDQSMRNNTKALRLRWAYLFMSLAIPALIIHALVVQQILATV